MRTTVALVFAAALLSGTPAWADKPGADWMPAAQVKQKLMDAGYTSITEFEADDGHWEGEGVKNGKKMQFHADPKTGAIMSEKPND
ncbi:PepSY domain-containing protein [Methylobacterium sp. WL8]|uniref:PepSY domain-containing protein n=1 Tax=Methylobacterium sp. WL8 TaxID=2603899 RepID=UPI0011C87B4A|nr:PepSY domain-containing protein [Methylobacterium sp. WL8]TXN80293.1 PepSY domain-containing protein [Methylobacterium sp. WL8]